MQLSDKVAVSDNVVSREVSGETVLLNLDTGTYYGLAAVGCRIWALIEQEAQTLQAICTSLLEEFEVAEEEVQRDVLALAADLQEHGLLVKAG